MARQPRELRVYQGHITHTGGGLVRIRWPGRPRSLRYTPLRDEMGQIHCVDWSRPSAHTRRLARAIVLAEYQSSALANELAMQAETHLILYRARRWYLLPRDVRRLVQSLLPKDRLDSLTYRLPDHLHRYWVDDGQPGFGTGPSSVIF